tara:strand:+ start:314 stop:484 length:171 start_codon:yes stop_codon:yes gene_type:complete
MLSGNERPAKPIMKSEIGLLMEPTIDVLLFDSRSMVVKVIPQAKNNSDSYRLLKGK